MKKKFLIVLMVIWTSMVSFDFAHAQQQQNVAFFQAIPDLPLMSGLTEAADMTLIYDKPEGRVVEVIALGRNMTEESVSAYYHQVLPQMGWALHSQTGHFMRGSEDLGLSIENSDGLLVLRINIVPRS